jgi:hypothetical protein
MKKLIIILCLLTITVQVYSKHTCTGSSNCTACKTCRYCKHCNKDKGKCGVCTGKKSVTKLKKAKKLK